MPTPGAFLRARVIPGAPDLTRLILAYYLGERGLRSPAAWASTIGLVDVSNVLVGQAPVAGAPTATVRIPASMASQSPHRRRR